MPEETNVTPVEGEETTAENTDAVIAVDSAAEWTESESVLTWQEDMLKEDEKVNTTPESEESTVTPPDVSEPGIEPEVIPEPVNKIDLHYNPTIPVKEETNQRIKMARRGEERVSRDRVSKD